MESRANPTDAALLELARKVADLLVQQDLMLATAESCTGGWIAKALTDLPGSSAWFHAGLVTYSYQAKEDLLGVDPDTLERTGAVSEETVLEMVSGALAHPGADVAVAVTGIAGPGGGTSDKPVGTVWISWKLRDAEPDAQIFLFAGDREAVRRRTVAAALSGLRQRLTA